jgi:hypothetical protein
MICRTLSLVSAPFPEFVYSDSLRPVHQDREQVPHPFPIRTKQEPTRPVQHPRLLLKDETLSFNSFFPY